MALPPTAKVTRIWGDGGSWDDLGEQHQLSLSRTSRKVVMEMATKALKIEQSHHRPHHVEPATAEATCKELHLGLKALGVSFHLPINAYIRVSVNSRSAV